MGLPDAQLSCQFVVSDIQDGKDSSHEVLRLGHSWVTGQSSHRDRCPSSWFRRCGADGVRSCKSGDEGHSV